MAITTKGAVELVELGKFFAIAGRRFDAGQTAPEMFSDAIDAMWHRLAERPEAQGAFTAEHAGRKLTHVEAAGSGLIAWVGAYEETYGPLPEIWFTHADGTVDEYALAHYRDTGTVVAEWDCAPAPGDDEDVQPKRTTR
ncbi:hypothetical protein [Streptomyces sp. NPDC056672]|uniref:hypothetical protein n=1 Tax=Streptomyces sp. NPDC056672 TaxID=3345906 RepID=UPI0036817ED3